MCKSYFRPCKFFVDLQKMWQKKKNLNISSFQLGFFKRLTKEEMAKNLNEKLEKARMKEDLDVCVAEIEEIEDDLSSS